MLFTVVVKTQGFARPIDFTAYSRLANNMTCKFMLFNILTVIITEFRIFDRNLIFVRALAVYSCHNSFSVTPTGAAPHGFLCSQVWHKVLLRLSIVDVQLRRLASIDVQLRTSEHHR